MADFWSTPLVSSASSAFTAPGVLLATSSRSSSTGSSALAGGVVSASRTGVAAPQRAGSVLWVCSMGLAIALRKSERAKIARAHRLVQRHAAASTTATTASYRIGQVDGKGYLGAFAGRKILPGELIVSEAPCLTCTDDGSMMIAVQKQFDALPAETQSALMTLYDHNVQAGETKTLKGIVRSNTLLLGSDAAPGGVYLNLGRINHSCAPNCEATWNPKLGELQLFASVDIREGQELYIPYTEVRAPRAERRALLFSRFKFQCECSVCNDSSVANERSDKRRAQIQENDAEAKKSGSSQPRRTISLLSKQLQLYDAEGLHLPRERKMACYNAFQLSLLDNSPKEAGNWATKAHRYACLCNGADHADTQLLLKYSKNPKSHPIFKDR